MNLSSPGRSAGAIFFLRSGLIILHFKFAKSNHPIMKLTLQALAIFFILTGITFLIMPDSVLSFIEGISSESWFYYTAIIARLLLGILFFKAAPLTKFPTVFKVIGILAIIAAIAFIAIGHQKFQEFINSLISNLGQFAPITGLATMAFGGFLLYAIGNKTATEKSA